jgi:hypothetical protein
MGWQDAPVIENAAPQPKWASAPEVGNGDAGHTNTAADAAKSFLTGVAESGASFFGGPGDIGAAVHGGKTELNGAVAQSPLPASVPFIGGVPLPTSKGIVDAITAPFGGAHEPETQAGHYAETVGAFAPAAANPGSVINRAARVVVPAFMSEEAGQATKGTKLEPYARAAGALAGGLTVGAAEGVGARRAMPVAPTNDDLRSAANKIYIQAKNSGLTIRADAYDGLVGDINATLKDEGYHAKLHPKVSGVIDALDEAKGQNVDIGELERLRRIAQGAAKSIEPDERRVAGLAIKKIDGFMDGLQPAETTAGDPAVAKTLSDARAIWTKMRKSETIENLIERAQSRATTANGNLAASLRGEFQALLKNKKAMRGFSQTEREAIRKVAQNDSLTGALSALGVFRPRGLAAMLEGTGAASHVISTGDVTNALPYVGAAAAGYGAQKAANAITASRAAHASELMRLGPQEIQQQSSPIATNALMNLFLSQSTKPVAQ